MNLNHGFTLLAGLLAAGASVRSATPLTTGHADVGIGYESGAFNLHVHDEVNDIEYSPADALLVVRSAALQRSPGGDYRFLGPVGTPVWVLPKVQNPDLLFLGIGAEELAPADWMGTLQFSLKSVSGPGSFYLWNSDAFGRPEVLMDSADGIGPGDRTSVIPGSHAHLNWGFSEPGSYSIAFEAAGVHVMDGPQVSGPVAYHFQVVPEPGTLALTALGSGVLLLLIRRRQD